MLVHWSGLGLRLVKDVWWTWYIFKVKFCQILHVRMAERSKAPDSRVKLFLHRSILVHECGRGFESPFWQIFYMYMRIYICVISHRFSGNVGIRLSTWHSNIVDMTLQNKIKLFSNKYSFNCEKIRGHPGLNQGPLDLQSNALPLSYIPDASCSFHILPEQE